MKGALDGNEYVDAGTAVAYSTLSRIVGKAPPVAKGVTYERILNARAEPQNWLTYYGAYDGQRYSPLDQINGATSASSSRHGCSRPARWACTRARRRTRSRPPRSSSTASCTSPAGTAGCWALDARNGNELWRYRHASPFDVSLCCGNVNRGVAVAEGKVFMTTLNAHIIALDAETGKKVWDQTYGDVRAGESATVAPLIVKDMVIVGSSGGEFGVRGHTDAFKLETGERVWRCYMVPKPGEPGSETWPDDGEAWQRGGANCWVTPTYDPDLNLLYYGTGNPCPDFDGGVREGDNLFTDSGVAVDADTGEIKAHFQYTPHDLWDYDSTMEHILFDLDGQKLAAHFDKNGFLYILDRTDMYAGPGGAVRRPHRLGRGRREGQRDAAAVSPTRKATRSTSGRARPAPRSGRTRATARRRSSSTSRCRTSARRPRGGAGSSRRASRTGAPASPWTARTGRVRQRLRPAHRPGALALDATTSRCARRCWPRAATSCSAGSRPASSTRWDAEHRRPAVAVPVRQRPPQQPVDVQRRRQAVHRRADRLGRLGRRVPARDARVRPTAARCSRSRCRSRQRN